MTAATGARKSFRRSSQLTCFSSYLLRVFEYALPSLPELALRLEYQWLARVGKLRNYNRC